MKEGGEQLKQNKTFKKNKKNPTKPSLKEGWSIFFSPLTWPIPKVYQKNKKTNACKYFLWKQVK